MFERDKKLFEDFPELYRGKNDNSRDNRVVGGLEINEGWYDLVYDLSEDIIEYCEENDHEIPKVFQVKEKFGGLRFYFESGDIDEEIYDIVNKAEHKSYQTCEVCGEEGVLCERKEGHWLKTLCEEHSEELGYRPTNSKLKKQVTGENIEDLTD